MSKFNEYLEAIKTPPTTDWEKYQNNFRLRKTVGKWIAVHGTKQIAEAKSKEELKKKVDKWIDDHTDPGYLADEARGQI